MVGKQIMASNQIKSHFKSKIINITASESITETGKFSLKKALQQFSLLFHIVFQLIFFRPIFCYLALTTSGFAFYRDFIIILFARISRVPLVYHLHHKGLSNKYNSLFKKLIYYIVFYETNVIIQSWYLFDDLIKFVDRENIYICPNGIDLNIKSNVSGPRSSFLIISNFFRSKGILDLIETCIILKSRNIDFQINLIGNNGDLSMNDLLFIIKEKGLIENFHILGPMYGETKKKYLDSSSIFVFPTQNDCFPLVLLEAMQFSLPVISTYEGGIPDIVIDGETGYLVPQRDIQALADRMQELIENPQLREQMGQAGRKRYEELFTAEIFENRLLEILQQVSLKYT